MMRRLRLVGLIPLLGLLVSVQPAGSATTAIFHRPIVSVGANQSSNWSGYNQGSIEQGGKMFSLGRWTLWVGRHETTLRDRPSLAGVVKDR